MDYPSILPCPQIEGYQVSVVYGTSGVTFENGMTRRRKGLKQEKHLFQLSIVLSTAQLWAWQNWANAKGYEWHWMKLASDLAGFRDTPVAAHYIRYISDISIEPVDAKYFRVSVQAEMELNSVPPGSFEPTGNWIVAQTPASPSNLNLVSAETAAGITPAIDDIAAGYPGLPAA